MITALPKDPRCSIENYVGVERAEKKPKGCEFPVSVCPECRRVFQKTLKITSVREKGKIKPIKVFMEEYLGDFPKLGLDKKACSECNKKKVN